MARRLDTSSLQGIRDDFTDSTHYEWLTKLLTGQNLQHNGLSSEGNQVRD